MKNYFKKLIIFIIVLLGCAFFFVANDATEADAASKYIDYSGVGTKIKNPIIINNGQAKNSKYATTDGNYLDVNVYKGSYTYRTVLDAWYLKPFSSWQTNNNKTNVDFYTYQGSKTVQEYDVQNRNEYTYKRWDPKKNPVYKTYYYCDYEGTKWWNSNALFNHTESSPNGYPGPETNYRIVRRYTQQVIVSYNGGWEYDNTWRTSSPVNSSNKGKWVTNQTRTTYRYRQRTRTWDPITNPGIETIPLNYSLYDESGELFGYGIKMSDFCDISKHASQAALEFVPSDYNYYTTIYYLNTDKVFQELSIALLEEFAGDPYIESLKNGINMGVISFEALMSILFKYFGESAILQALGDVGFILDLIIAAGSIADLCLQTEKIISYNDFIAYLVNISNYNYMAIEFLIDSECFPSARWLLHGYYDKKTDSNDDLKYISMRFSDNFKNTAYESTLENKYDYTTDYYGKIEYVNDLEGLKADFSNYFGSYDIFSWISIF